MFLAAPPDFWASDCCAAQERLRAGGAAQERLAAPADFWERAVAKSDALASRRQKANAKREVKPSL